MLQIYTIILTTFTVEVYYTFAHTCPLDVKVNISDGKRYGDNIVKDVIVYSPNDYFHENGTIYGCTCSAKKCISKCCAEGTMMTMEGCTERKRGFMVNVYRKTSVIGFGDFHLSTGLKCNERHGLFPKANPNESFFIQPDGRLFVPRTNQYLENYLYCVDYLREDVNSSKAIIAFVCDDIPEGTHLVIGMIISMPFLLATFLVYALLPDRNLPAKALMCYVLSLLFAYILLVTIQLNAGHKATTCISLAFFCYYFFMASFFWMNASCLDIFFTFSGIRGLLGDKKKEHKRFAYYSAYAWGVPLLMVGFASIFTFAYTDANNSFYTGLGQGQCWFRNGWATGIYFYFPIAILLIVNMVLFGVTTYKIKRVQKDTKMLKNVDSRKHKYDNNDKQRFNLYVKLLFAMGINWSMEVISWAIMWKWANVPDYVWVLTDFCNAVYGVFIFFIFVFKRNIWMLLKKRYLQLTGRPQQAHNLTSTHRTTVSQVSSSEA